MAHTEPADEEPETPSGVSADTPKGRSAFRRMGRELTSEELQSPGVTKILMDDVDRLEVENRRLSSFETKYHLADKNVAILTNKLAVAKSFEIISTGTIAIGGVLAGFVPSLSSNTVHVAFTAFAAVALIVTGVIAKWKAA